MRRPRSLAWVVHPLADEPALLAELGMGPEDCRSADAYWRYHDSVYFVQIQGCSSPHEAPGLYYRFDREYRQDNFVVLTAKATVASEDFHRVLGLLETLIDDGSIDAAREALQDGRSRWLAGEEPLTVEQ